MKQRRIDYDVANDCIRDLLIEEIDIIPLPENIKYMIMKKFVMLNDIRFVCVEDIHWDQLLTYKKLSEEFISRHIEHMMGVIEMICLCKCQTLSESFIEKHIDVLNICIIRKNQKLSSSFSERLRLYEQVNRSHQ